MASDNLRDLVVAIRSISSSTASENTNLLSKPILAYIDSAVSECYLPATVCQQFEKAFGLFIDQKRKWFNTGHSATLRSFRPQRYLCNSTQLYKPVLPSQADCRRKHAVFSDSTAPIRVALPATLPTNTSISNTGSDSDPKSSKTWAAGAIAGIAIGAVVLLAFLITLFFVFQRSGRGDEAGMAGARGRGPIEEQRTPMANLEVEDRGLG
ncbi:hypothetical protein MBM_01076 [Drepanopeziza brunnea f. sp. 'multigermtubi' MB_m1]|uniref:Uncharacterized protein n=1 Tax=Marssonina brunnea f. sp. multigermtubi (strain MB_m1) TaxID=1072389 RepID=K1Y5D6_MARBU|nr:uncharacterized protein MBM_01076 [Drepanopeziza brunnea f. sp. 'multigermtubi' MB_m1]EKD20394.1 hypothetical protein MBM_01076 [Drepanopeziza brunnea f. sp. 'multigermtubi' MB_m1]